MSLSEQEQQTLREIERSLLAEDPKFGSSVQSESSPVGTGGALTLRGIALVVVGLTMLIGGVALAQSSLWFVILSIVGFLVMFAAGVWMLRSKPTHGAGAVLRGSVQGKTKQGNGGSTAASRMEENFRRRFER
ncbi:MAG: DUF3040 domain-containing protein [Corynebacterium sp.]|nr:DUF3040 domain-containing protein [Corynebacterium sp.]